MKRLLVLLCPLLLIACKHPLAIVGEGDIVDLNGSAFGCLLEEFQAGASNCLENNVVGDYVVNYSAVPREGWKFSHWDGNCGHLTQAPACRFDVSALLVDYWDSNFSTVQLPALTAVFVEDFAEPQEGDLWVLDALTVGPIWDRGINAFDSAIGWNDCSNDGGTACPSIDWQFIADAERGDVLEVSHSPTGDPAGLFIATGSVVDLSDYAEGSLVFDIKVLSGDSKITVKLDCVWPCTSGDFPLGSRGASGWETVEVALSSFVVGGLNLDSVSTGLVIWATESTDTVFRIDNVRFTGIAEGAIPPKQPDKSGDYQITAYGAGTISDTINPEGYRCVFDFGDWIYNAGIVEPAIAYCDTGTGIPSGTPTQLYPQLTGPAESRPTPTHRWWGSVPFLGEMTVGDPNDAAHITPDPVTARITERGVRVMGIPAGLGAYGDNFYYPIPDPFSEVFDGVAIANSDHQEMEAYLKDHSDGSATVEWHAAGAAVMEATFVHGSPYVYFKVYAGQMLIRTLRSNGGEKGVFYNQDNSLGIWTSVAGNHNNFLVIGEGATSFDNIEGNEIIIRNDSNAFTLALLPHIGANPDPDLVDFFKNSARNVVAVVQVDHLVDRGSNTVTVTHQYLDESGKPIETIAGMHPLHWKNSSLETSGYDVRSARGTIKFARTDHFSYELPYVGVLPSLPSLEETFDQAILEDLVRDFVEQGASSWNDRNDAYWAGKNYGKVSELIAIADSIGMNAEASQLRDWLKSELEDWFSATTGGNLDTTKYFMYDENWNTLLAMEESFASHQQLNDHHFHYGYLVRAAAEICRAEADWCSDEQFGPIIELMIRDYAGGRGDHMFPYLRNFDPANGFSWASGKVNFVRGNNNESTSEAANAYGAMVLYGLITGNDELVERGMYLHASTSAAYWEYWNNIDGYNSIGEKDNNFPPGYERITTSIVWGDGAVFSTWFSAAYAHILGIQGLPSNPLILHVGLYSDYMKDYVALGLSQSSNRQPSGLASDQWRDLWWNLMAMTDAEAALADYANVDSYTPEAGETRAHTYHWLHTFNKLGHLLTGTGSLTVDYPAAMAFQNQGVVTYVVYNYDIVERLVTYSDGTIVNAAPGIFTVVYK